MNKKLLILLVAIAFIPMFGCYTQIVTQETTIELPDSATVNVTNNYDIEYVGYGYRYSGLDYYGGYQPYWYDNYYTPYYNPYRAYIYPWRPFAHRPFVRPHRPDWRLPFDYKHPRQFGTTWNIVKPTNPPRVAPRHLGPGRESVRDAIIKREVSTRYIPQRVQMQNRTPANRDSRQSYAPTGRGNERNYPIQRQEQRIVNAPSHTPQTHSAPAPTQSSGGNRSSGATRNR